MSWKSVEWSSSKPFHAFSLRPFREYVSNSGWVTEAGQPSSNYIYIFFLDTYITASFRRLGWRTAEEKEHCERRFCRPHFPRSSADSLWAPGSGLQRELLSNWCVTSDTLDKTPIFVLNSLFWSIKHIFGIFAKQTIKKKINKRRVVVAATRRRAILLAGDYKGILSQMWLWRYRFLGQFSMAAGSSAPLWYFHGAD